MKELDLSKTGYYDYLIRVDKDTGERYISDPGVSTEMTKVKVGLYSSDAGLDYSPVTKKGGIIEK